MESIDYKFVDGRLFKLIDVNYDYPDDANKCSERESRVVVVNATTEPNGEGLLTINDKSELTVQKISFRDVPIDNLWMPVPEIGDWENLSNRSNGNVELPRATR